MPYPDESYPQGVRQFPLCIPITPEDENTPMLRQTWQILETLEIPFLCAFGEQDNVSRGDHSTLSGRIPGAKVHDHIVIPGAGHFIQEDQPAAIDDGRLLLELLIACRFRMGAAPPG